MELFFMTLTTGIMVGGIYALVALGWVLIYKCSGVLNLAMGELTLIGAYTSLTFYSMGLPFLVSLGISLVIGFVLGILTERIFLDRLIGEPVLTVIMVTVGLSFFFKPCRPRPMTKWRPFRLASAPASFTPPRGPSRLWPPASGGRCWATSTD
jgi:branched-subunit amino acid ABC-type transport system permease component